MPTPASIPRTLGSLVLLTLLVAGGLAGCGGGDDDEDASGGGGPEPTLPPDDLSVVDERVEATSDPVAGGSLVYAIGAETDGWNPTQSAWAPEGTLIARTVYDPLAAFDEEGVAQPFLAESIEPDATYTHWTITLRPGVTFHNGDPLTADAVKVVLEGHRDSALSSPAVAPIESVEVRNELTAVVTMSDPWVAFPDILTAQLGVVPHPMVVENDIRDEPLGTGPFRFVRWQPNDSFETERNPDYWREGLPYLDRLEFRSIPDTESRRAAFEAGDFDVFLGGAPEDIAIYRDQAQTGDDVQYFGDRGENEEGFVQLNLKAPPFDDLRVRQALAYATDYETFNQVIDQGLLRMADGPFVPENPFYVDTDFPVYDLAAAQALVEEVEAESGEPLRFTLQNTADDVSYQQSSLLKEMWEQAGFEVELVFTEQAQYIFDALAGDYQANLWRQFGAPDPDGDSQWWRSTSSLNFANIDDPEIDAALQVGREDPDPEARREAYATLQQRLTDLLAYLWLSHVEWAIVARPWVQGIADSTLPDGSPAKPFVAGTHRLEQIWIDPGLQ